VIVLLSLPSWARGASSPKSSFYLEVPYKLSLKEKDELPLGKVYEKLVDL
jgi:hypothetical protein